MKKVKKDKTISKGWIGRWNDGSIGWCSPEHLSGHTRWADKPAERYYVSNKDWFYMCKITVEVLKNKKGNYIKRSAKALKINKT